MRIGRDKSEDTTSDKATLKKKVQFEPPSMVEGKDVVIFIFDKPIGQRASHIESVKGRKECLGSNDDRYVSDLPTKPA